MKGGHKNKYSWIVIVAVIIFLVFMVAVLFWKYSDLKKNSDNTAKDSTRQILAAVSKMYDVPKNDQPTIALVQDKSKLQDQAFFRKVENGDYVLIFPKSKFALVYRPKANKLVNAGPLSLEQGAPIPKDTPKEPN
jgi:hypothetical protein